MNYLIILIIGIISYYFHRRLAKIELPPQKEDLDYPQTIVQKFEITDLNNFEQKIKDMFDLALEDWNHESLSHFSDTIYTWNKNDLTLRIRARKVEAGKKFKIKIQQLVLGRDYNKILDYFRETIFILQRDNKKCKSIFDYLTQILHQLEYNQMVQERELSQTKTLQKMEELDKLLVSKTRDRKIDDLLRK
jgi:hypothetical protein